MKSHFLTLVLSALSLASPCMANDCQSLGSKAEKAGCLWKEATAAEHEMKVSYGCALAALAAHDEQFPRHKFRDRFAANQSHWVRQLKEDCSLAADMAMGSVGAIIEPGCLANGFSGRDLGLRQTAHQFEDFEAKPTLECQRRSD